jgi:hypothetical protein
VGRAALGAAAKSKTGGVRVTEAQDNYFKKTYGSLGKFLQMKVNEELAKAAEMQTEMEKGMRCSGDTHVIPHRGCILR